jgi:hypothetical protein
MNRLLLPFMVIVGAALMGCTTSPATGKSSPLARFFLEAQGSAGERIILPQSETEISIARKPVLTEFDLVSVEIAQVELGKCLQFRFTPAASRDLYRLSVDNLGQRLVLVVDGHAMGARRIDRPIADGTLLMFVETPDDALRALQMGLRQTSVEIQRVARKL